MGYERNALDQIEKRNLTLQLLVWHGQNLPYDIPTLLHVLSDQPVTFPLQTVQFQMYCFD